MEFPWLLAKTLIAPLLMGIATWVSGRWGHRVGGIFAGLPLTSAPVVVILALDRGPEFAAEACRGMLQTVAALAVFAFAYAWLARKLPPGSTAVFSWVLFAVFVWEIRQIDIPPGWMFGIDCVTLAACFAGIPRTQIRKSQASSQPWWDTPLRMGMAGAVTLAITCLAARLGPRLSGLLTPLPVVATILTFFTHHKHGGAAAATLLRGMIPVLHKGP